MSNLQLKASNPDYSVWVSASAGTGKTKILTDRVLRLLIQDISPQKILCLTFTNAAAGEMQCRIQNKLSEWAAMDEKTLHNELILLTGSEPSRDEIANARSIHHKLLNYQNSINIYTIHSFCQKILKTFPFEAGVSPSFQILDKIMAREIINQIKRQIYSNSSNEDVTDFLSANFHDTIIDDIINEIIDSGLRFKQLFAQANCFEIFESSKVKTEIICQGQVVSKIEDILFLLQKLIAQHNNPIEMPDDINSFFLTKDGGKRKTIILKKIRLANPEFASIIEELQECYYQLDQLTKTNLMYRYSALMLKFAHILITKYDEYKNSKNFLDYDDLIFCTKELLNNKDTKDWVLYKLDGGVKHLLVDEAQDTSPEQWLIIEALITEFYSGGIEDEHRTIFVVGDEKQSIFSFQGADIDSFNIVKQQLQDRLFSVGKNFEIINLEYSYRSSAAILNIVHNVFAKIKDLKPYLFTADNPKILPVRSNDDGKVELWSLVSKNKSSKLFWPLVEEHFENSESEQILAVKIAEFIKHQIDKKIVIPSTGKATTPGDFMILVRKRDKLTLEVIKQLKKHNLATSGIDKMMLGNNLSVIDLISAAKFVLNPDDDLNLAHLIKSPIIGADEAELYNFALARRDLSMWRVIKSAAEIGDFKNIYTKLMKLIDLYHFTYVGNFFHILVDQFNLREVFLQFNGNDSNDAVNELLYLSYNYADNQNISLQNFVYWFEANEMEVQRNVEISDKIRVMTVHGAKGLQAPIVILCDTTKIPKGKEQFVWDEDGRAFYAMSSKIAPETLKELKNQADQKELQEYLRLLYVAMTRAEDHLIICGHHDSKLPDNCWYSLVANAMNVKIEYEQEQTDLNIATDIQKSRDNSNELILNSDDISQNMVKTLNHWEDKCKNFIDGKPDRVKASEIKLVSSHSILEMRDHFQYGRMFHKILEDAIKSGNINNLSTHPLIFTLPFAIQKKILTSIDNLIKNDEFIDITSHEVKSEVNIGIWQDGRAKIGRIDLISVSSERLIIVDYKSDRYVPQNKNEVPAAYIDQLNFYRHMMQELYPLHRIVCKILWLENALFTTI